MRQYIVKKEINLNVIAVEIFDINHNNKILCETDQQCHSICYNCISSILDLYWIC